jgi:hypothetical protein
MPQTATMSPRERILHGLHALVERLSPRIAVEAQGRRELVNLPALAEQATAQLEEQARERHIRMELDIEPDVLVMGDPEGLRRLVAQLMKTCLQNTPTGGHLRLEGTIHHEWVKLSLSSAWPEPNVLLGAQPHFVEEVLHSHGASLQVLPLASEGHRLVCQLPIG